MTAPALDIELCQAAADCYSPAGKWEDTFFTSGVWYATRKNSAGERILAFRGSKTIEDWARDLDGWPTRDPQVGWCAEGFHDGMRDVLAAWSKLFALDRCWITGHSLGAARAAIMAGLLAKRAIISPRGLVVFGCPRPGFGKLKRICQGLRVCRVYSNKDDPVPDLPEPLWKILPYRHPAKPIMLQAGRTPGDDGPFSAHHIARYQLGLKQL